MSTDIRLPEDWILLSQYEKLCEMNGIQSNFRLEVCMPDRPNMKIPGRIVSFWANEPTICIPLTKQQEEANRLFRKEHGWYSDKKAPFYYDANYIRYNPETTPVRILKAKEYNLILADIQIGDFVQFRGQRTPSHVRKILKIDKTVVFNEIYNSKFEPTYNATDNNIFSIIKIVKKGS